MLCLLNFIKYSWISFKFQQQVKRHYYHNLSFSCLDKDLLTAYFLNDPYKISRNDLRKRNEPCIHLYGETPLHTYEKIGKEIDLKMTDCVLELGCGRGRGLFFLNQFFNCRVIGIERILPFFNIARYLKQKHAMQDVSFIYGDMLTVPFPPASIVYLYGTALQDPTIFLLTQKLKTFLPQATIVSVSYPLSDYDSTGFQVKKSFTVEFLWGTTTAYLETIRLS